MLEVIRMHVGRFILLFVLGMSSEGWSQGLALSEKNDRKIPFTTRREVALIYTLTDTTISIEVVNDYPGIIVQSKLDKDFSRNLRKYRNMIRQAETGDFTGSGNYLYQILIKPVSVYLKDVSRLVIYPDSVLSDLPFETLVSGLNFLPGCVRPRPRFLVEDYEIVYRLIDWLPFQAGNPAMIRDQLPGQIHLIGLAPALEPSHPDYLPYVEQELDSLRTLFHAKGLTYRFLNIRQELLEDEVRRPGIGTILHFAGHYHPGCFPDSNAGFLQCITDPIDRRKHESGQYYSVKEISSLRFRADLIVLNGCRSGYLRMESGSLRNQTPPILIGSGASNIISTLWSVADHLALRFMVAFYRNLLSGTSYATALRDTKLRMLSSRETSLPHVWAPYVLTTGP
jgi:CHAT domain-containing protein